MCPHPSKTQDKKEINKLLIPSFLLAVVDYPLTPWFISGLYFVIMTVLSFIYHTIGNYGVETDFYWKYLPNAQLIQHGIIPIDSVMGPVYPMILAVFGLVVPDLFSAARLINILSASATLLFTYKLLQSLFRSDLALVVTLMLSVNLAFVLFTYTVGTDMFFCFILTVSCIPPVEKSTISSRQNSFTGL